MCDDNFGNVAAQVACRQLGLPWTKAVAVGAASYGQGNLAIRMDEVSCQARAFLVYNTMWKCLTWLRRCAPVRESLTSQAWLVKPNV